MKRLFQILFLLYVCLTFGLGVQAQGGKKLSVRQWVDHADKFNCVLPQERVYLHFDNTGYFMEEIMWFKAYVLSSDSGRYTSKSRVLYVELVNPSGDVIQVRKLEIKNGQANGEFVLQDLFVSGFYEVRAYTRYMTNWGKDAVFSRVFPIFHTPRKKGDYSRLVMSQFDKRVQLPDNRETDSVKNAAMNVRFYPEGGALVDGLTSRVAFAVWDKSGAHFETSGFLLSGEDTLCAVSTLREGRGVFECKYAGNPLILVLKDTNGRWRRFPLPDARSEGCALRVDALEGDSVEIRVESRFGSLPSKRSKKIGVVVTHRGMSEVCDSFIVDGSAFRRSYNRSLFQDGVNEVSVFDTEGRVLADRMFFIYPRKEGGKISAEIENDYILPYRKVGVHLRSSIPETTFSLAVRDAETDVNGTGLNAALWHLLASDLKGYIENAGYYLENDGEERRRAADLLMMVQGWRRYDFEMMNGRNKIHLVQPAENGLLLMGRLYPYKKKDKVGGVDLSVVLANEDKDMLAGTMTTDAKGYYAFMLPDCYNSWEMVLRTSIEDKNKKYHIGINRNFSPMVRRLSHGEMQKLPLDTLRTVLREVKDTSRMEVDADVHAISTVEVKAKRYRTARSAWESESVVEDLARLAYFCEPEADKIIDRGEDLPTLYEWLQGKNNLFEGGDVISGLSPYIKKEYNYMDIGPSYSGRPVLWYVDNRFLFATSMPARYSATPDQDVDEKTGMPIVAEVAMGRFPVFIDEVKSVFISEKSLLSNILDSSWPKLNVTSVFVYTYGLQKRPAKGLRYTHFEGYRTPAAFVSPDYSLMPPEEDFRRTLYWNPNVKTDKEGNAKVEFYNNSSCKQLIISAEGIAEDGTPLVY